VVRSHDDDGPSLDSPHPRVNVPRFLPRLGQSQQALLPLLSARGIRSTVAPLYFMGHNPQLSLLTAGRQMGSVLDPCTHLRQLPWAERSEAFRSFAFGNDPEAYEPDRARLSDDQLLHLAVDPLDAQRSRGATLMLTTFHLAGSLGSRGREIELALARTGVEHFRRQRLEEPLPFAPLQTPREIFATLAVSASELSSPSARQALADAYLDIGADGVWVKIARFHERASLTAIRAASAFLDALRDGGIPVVSCGAGQLHLALLADDLSASIGLAEGERFSIPRKWRPESADGKRRGRTRMAFHPKMHWSFRVGSDEAARAFQADPCGCGVHPARKSPAGLLVARHAAILRAEQAAEALAGLRGERREWLLAASAMASWKAADAGIPGMHMAMQRYQAVFEGLDAGREVAAPGEQAEL
jgi:hypothetical protein